MRVKALALVLVLVVALMAGCTSNEETSSTNEPADTVSAASVVTDEASLLKAMSKDGTWIIIFEDDFTTDKELVLEGEFTNKDKPARKIALYTQDENRNITASYTLTAPKLTIKSENTTIKGGTFVGDVYVEANGFTLTEATIEGNVYFANEEVKSTFKLGENATVTGATEVK
ncbi:hypothetical protein [Thermohalobacter berrensis]|uniref:Lipoprotein n=1 Tax=Thermohalobacter berrensis TaxID=99594 RepID=A0A419T7K7_9FIRM|nr:hypothetical protein [Thermohalobacter berrensis]RKD33425.1 hypothetical protein BET03_09225 [Thermohalobacter berrensis]